MRRRVLHNLALAFPEKTGAQRRAIARAFWRGFGQSAFEALDPDRLMRGLDQGLEIEGLEHVVAAQKQLGGATAEQNVKTGLVFVHAHQAAWELIFPVIEQLMGPVSGIYAPVSIPAIHRRVLYRRILFGGRPIPALFRMQRPMGLRIEIGQAPDPGFGSTRGWGPRARLLWFASANISWGNPYCSDGKGPPDPCRFATLRAWQICFTVLPDLMGTIRLKQTKGQDRARI